VPEAAAQAEAPAVVAAVVVAPGPPVVVLQAAREQALAAYKRQLSYPGGRKVRRPVENVA
jgi:hypothetical protein